MLILNVPLSLITLAMACVMLFVTRKLSALSGKYFGLQQRDLGAVDGYIEEMLDGQKVVKVFCHEQQARDGFRVLNDKLRDSADKANAYANITMPINANIGNLSYVLCAVIGTLLALNGVGGVTVGTIVAFVSLNKSFTQPITQISQQMNSIVMAAAGAQRVFETMDQTPRAGRRLCGDGQRQRTGRRQPGAHRRAHRRVGPETPPQGRRHRHLHQAGRRHCI